uniref:Uncharacterized protein n=1 Tax=Meloidogyne enterolobii TaxID=390850 RepID=A0A6V7U1K3_MELEN|nr:unnamed protein product [Meloidogyne enterolobii]
MLKYFLLIGQISCSRFKFKPSLNYCTNIDFNLLLNWKCVLDEIVSLSRTFHGIVVRITNNFELNLFCMLEIILIF